MKLQVCVRRCIASIAARAGDPKSVKAVKSQPRQPLWSSGVVLGKSNATEIIRGAGKAPRRNAGAEAKVAKEGA